MILWIRWQFRCDHDGVSSTGVDATDRLAAIAALPAAGWVVQDPDTTAERHICGRCARQLALA